MKAEKFRYVRLAASALIMLCVGIVYMWSVFGTYIIGDAGFGWTRDESALTASIMIGCFSFGGLVGGRLQDALGPHRVVLAGIVGFVAGIVLASFVISSEPASRVLVYLTFGVLGGFSVGCIYNSIMTCMQKWFPDKINGVMGVVVSCFGFATVIFSPIARTIADEGGVQLSFRVLAGVFFVVCLAGSFFVKNPPQGWLPEGFVPKTYTIDPNQRQYTLKESIRTPQLWIIFLCIWFFTAAFFIFNPILATLAQSRGLDGWMSTITAMAAPFGMALGRLAMPLLIGKLGGRRNTALFIGVLVLATTVGLVFAQGPLFLLCIFLAGAMGGAPGAVWPTWTSENFGLTHQGANYGFVMVGLGLSSLVSYSIGSFFANTFAGGADYMYFVVGAVFALAGIVLVVLFRPIKKAAAAHEGGA